MSWLKRNWIFVAIGIVALGMLGIAVGFLVKGYVSNQRALSELNKAYDELTRLYNLDPHPGTEKNDNIARAREQQEEVRKFLKRVVEWYQRIPPIPDSAQITTEEFTARLRVTLDQLQKMAKQASVTLPRTNYAFTFESIRPKVKFEPASLPLLATQLGEIKAICEILLNAKVMAIDSIRRERVCVEDSPEIYPMDYIRETSITNDIAILTPYEVTFRCFSSELAGVLAGFANAQSTFIIKYLDVEPVTLAMAQEGMEGVEGYEPAPPYGVEGGPMPRRYLTPREVYGLGPETRPEPYVPPEGGFELGPGRPIRRPLPVPGRGGAQVILSETPFRVIMQVYVVKLNITQQQTQQ